MEFNLPYLVIVLLTILISMTLHEAMHGYASHWLGDDTAEMQGRLTLNPLAHIDPVMTILLPLSLAAIGAPPFGAAKPVPFNPYNLRFNEYGAALVGLAGPLTNFVLALVAYAIGGLFFGTNVALASSGLLGTFFFTFVYVNLAFFVFNMLPLPPLDGSRVLYAVAPDSVRRVMESMEHYGIYVVFAVIFVFNQQLGQLMSAAIGAILQLFGGLFG